MWWRQRLNQQLDRIEHKLDLVLVRIVEEENRIMATLDDLLSDVADESTVVASVETLLTNLSQQLAAAIAANDPAKIQAVKDAIDANKARLSAAVVANTPAATP